MANKDVILGQFEPQARAWLESGCARDVEFSGLTYQLQIAVGDDDYWPFLQFNDDGSVRDFFCTCSIADESGTCPHLAAAYLRIFNSYSEPLHARFEGSLWNRLGQLFADRQGYQTSCLQHDEGTYKIESPSNKLIFSVSPLNHAGQEFLKMIIDERVPETEETSLKFSGLTYEELSLWREGRPSEQLRYELSFWADLAKYMMWLQDSKRPYEITFDYDEVGLPQVLHVQCADLALSFYLSEANLAAIIPALNTVDSPLALHHLSDQVITSITFDRESGQFSVNAIGQAKEATGAVTGGIEIGEWIFVKGDGFYSKEKSQLFHSGTLTLDESRDLLTNNTGILNKYLEDEVVHCEAQTVKYSVWFDDEWSLHVDPYLFNKQDLTAGYSRFYGEWVYLDGHGFYPINNLVFEEGPVVVPSDQVATFVHKYRVLLNSIDGYNTHLTTVESHLSYRVSEEGTLTFASRVESPTDGENTRDFGDWVYVEAQGFYSKARGRVRTPVKAGATLKKSEVSGFIGLNRDELEMVPAFFTDVCPIAAASLKITLTGRQEALVIPEYRLHPEYRSDDVAFFDEYVYTQDYGFCKIPGVILLPERFRSPTKLKGQELQLFLTYEIDKLRPFISQLDRRLSPIKDLKLEISDATIGGPGQRGRLELQLSYRSEHGQVSLGDIYRNMSQGGRYIFSEAGLIDLREPRFAWISALDPSHFDQSTNRLQVTTLDFLRLKSAQEITCAPSSESALQLVEMFDQMQTPEPPDLTGLRSHLRHYQEIGVNWLWFLYSHGLSGLLCDDMGLGKTHQAMALMAAIVNDLDGTRRPKYLIVCPTSVIYHWKEKLAEFVPGLNVHTFYGTNRSLKPLGKADVLLTSYGVLRSDRDKISKVGFDLAIYDEIQVAKNQTSQTYHTLAKMDAAMRLGLTGTPIENSLRELKALFDLVLPTYMPSEAQFKEMFVYPIEREQNEERKVALRKVVRPFILRRKKEEVLTELPSKVEEKSHCDLSAQQLTLYNEAVMRTHDTLLHDLDDESKKISYVHIFAVLTALKRICDHPAVFLKEPRHYKRHASGKWDLFVELLSQAQESEKKVVVFSQYLDMLDIVELYLKENNIGYAQIRGSTVRRDKELKRFQEDPKCRVFVGSLQAAGLGIDLTAASIVIHYDRWWTNARESQATDRVHRLGQTRGVQVFKLLTLDTLEERIDAIIERKGQLMEEVVGSDEQGQLKAFTREELQALLQLAHEVKE